MTTDTAKLADEIEALAKDAFGGDWTVCVEEFGPHKGAVYIHAHDVDADGDGLARDYGKRICDMADNEDDEANAAFIAYCHQHKRAIISALRELEAVKAREVELRAALKPFAKSAERDWDDDAPDDTEVWCSQGLGYSPTKSWFTVGELRRARAALGGEG